MIVEVVGGADEVPEVRVEDVDDLKRLHLAVGALTDEDVDSALRGAGMGRLVDGENGVLDVAALRAAAPPKAPSPARGEDFDGLGAYAAGKGGGGGGGAGVEGHGGA